MVIRGFIGLEVQLSKDYTAEAKLRDPPPGQLPYRPTDLRPAITASGGILPQILKIVNGCVGFPCCVGLKITKNQKKTENAPKSPTKTKSPIQHPDTRHLTPLIHIPNPTSRHLTPETFNPHPASNFCAFLDGRSLTEDCRGFCQSTRCHRAFGHSNPVRFPIILYPSTKYEI